MIPVASITSDIASVGYPLLALLVMAESAGVPVPGETALITAAILTKTTGQLELPWVIAVAAAAAIVGDNLGYLFGRKAGRYVLERPGVFESQRRMVLDYGEPFFERHGPKAVFFGRWILGLRTWASWLAGATDMRWTSFALWNALGGISWAITIGVVGAVVGASAAHIVTTFGLWGLVAVVVVAVGLIVAHRVRARRRHRSRAAETSEAREPSTAAPERKPAPSSTDS